jgi:hypothetical protein
VVAASAAIWNLGRQLENVRTLRDQERIRDAIDTGIASVSETHRSLTDFGRYVATVEASVVMHGKVKCVKVKKMRHHQ